MADVQKRRPFAPAGEPEKKTIEDFDEPMVQMVFPYRVSITLQDLSRMDFREGIQPVPISLSGLNGPSAQANYLRLSGVKKYNGPELPARKDPLPPVPDPQDVPDPMEAITYLEENGCTLEDAVVLVRELGPARAKKDWNNKLLADAETAKEETKYIRDQQAVEAAADSARTGKPVKKAKT